MGKRQDITEYVAGEAIAITLQLRDRNQDAMDLATSPEVNLVISEQRSGKKLVTLSLGDGIQVTDEPMGECTAEIAPDRQRLLQAGTEYWYDLWADAGSGLMHQACGLFVLRRAIKP